MMGLQHCDFDYGTMEYLYLGLQLVFTEFSSQEDKFEVISSEDFLFRINDCNQRIRKEWEENRENGDFEIGEGLDEIVIIGADVTGLFPAMMARQTGRIVREVAQRSKLRYEGVNYKSAAMYVRYGMDQFEIRSLKLDSIVPRRRYHTGVEPRIKGREPLSGDPENDEVRWIFPGRDPTEMEKTNLMAACLEIGVRTCFENHVYQFGGKIYLQSKGGPIGMRVTMAAARVVMGDWGEE